MAKLQFITAFTLAALLSGAQIAPWTKSYNNAGNVKSAEVRPVLGRLEINGIYEGKNICIKNPEISEGDFCITKVYVNGAQAVQNTRLFELKLEPAALKLTKGDSINLVIIYKNACETTQFRIDSGIQSNARIVSFNADKNGTLKWTTLNESCKITFEIEQVRWKKWVKIGEVNGSGNRAENSYSFYAQPHSGENEIRIKQLNEFYLSKSVKWASEISACKYELKKDPKEIQFTIETLYEILDSRGKLVKKGFGISVSYNNLPKGKYTLNYDNSSAEFKL